VSPQGQEDSDHVDFGIYAVKCATGATCADRRIEPAEFPSIDTRGLLENDAELLVRGHPEKAPLSRIDYDINALTLQAVECDAVLLGAAESAYCYRIQFSPAYPLPDFNYLSGSPVFAHFTFDGIPQYVLVGILLRASGRERLGRFLSVEIMKPGLDALDGEKARTMAIGEVVHTISPLP